MQNKINEAYIGYLSTYTYMHLLSINGIFDEIEKLKALINTLRFDRFHERNTGNTLKSAIHTMNKLWKLYFSKSAK